MQQQSTWELFIAAAHSRKPVDMQMAEAFLRKALKFAESAHGDASAEAGLCLIELADLLEESGRLNEAEALTERYRQILFSQAKDAGMV